MTPVDLLALSGSARAEGTSPLARLLSAASRSAVAQGAVVSALEPARIALPFYDEPDVASPEPSSLAGLRGRLLAARGWIIASPDVCGAPAPMLLNLFAWLSRGRGEAPFAGKVCALLAVSDDPMGGLRGLNVLASVLSDLGVLVVPPVLGLAAAATTFDGSGDLADPGQRRRLEATMQALMSTCAWGSAP